jgi:hypothetical protein
MSDEMVYKLFVTIAASTGIASLDIREDDTIVAISLNTSSAGSAEVSFLSTPQASTNDTTGSLIGTPGGVDTSVNGIEIPVQAGERLYLHAGTGTGDVSAFIYTKGGAPTRQSVRRR